MTRRKSTEDIFGKNYQKTYLLIWFPRLLLGLKISETEVTFHRGTRCFSWTSGHSIKIIKIMQNSDSTKPNDSIHKPQTAGESGRGCRIAAWVKPSIFPAQHRLHTSGQNRCPRTAEEMGEAGSILISSSRHQQFAADTLPEPEQHLYIRVFEVVLFLSPPLPPWLAAFCIQPRF